MKLVGRIGLFVILSCVMLGIGAAGALKLEQFFYPNRFFPDGAGYAGGQTYAAQPVYDAGQDGGGQEWGEQIIEASAGQAFVVSADTRYVVREIDLNDGSMTESEQSVPLPYIGLNRDRLAEELEDYDSNPPLTELERGFEAIELSAFSKDRVVVCKYYRPEEEDAGEGYYLMVNDHVITVYHGDRRTVCMETDIMLESLPYSLQAEIMHGKYLETEEEVYHFLESYSS